MEAITNSNSFQYNIACDPDYAFLEVKIPEGKTLKVEASAMATMDTNLEMKTKFKGGFSRFLGGESIFINEFSAKNGTGKIGIAPSTPGDLKHIYLSGSEVIYLQNSAYLASSMGVNVETKFQGLMKGFFSGEGLFLIKCSGEGDLFFNSYGAIIQINVEDGYVVDTGNIVAFTSELEYTVQKLGGYKSLFLSGEGFVARFTGKGKLWIQTKKVRPLVSFANPFRPQKG
jgi:uncharacterized protein (TIGR00266 family)